MPRSRYLGVWRFRPARSGAEPVIVTRNGREAFAVMTVEQLDALRMETVRRTVTSPPSICERPHA